MKAFLHSVAEYLYANHNGQLQDIALVFPNKRARLFFNKYLAEISDQPVFSPQYYTITEFMEELSDVQVADSISLLFELYEVYAQISKSQESFDEFLFYCEMILADFDDIDKYRANAEMLFQNLVDLKALESQLDFLSEMQIKALKQFWSKFQPHDLSDEQKEFLSIWDLLIRIYQDFNAKLDSKNLAYEGKAYRLCIDKLLAGEVEIKHHKVAFVGFNALNNCERYLFNHLHKSKKGLFFWDYDEHYMNQANYHEAAFFLKDFTKQYPAPVGFSFESQINDPQKEFLQVNIPSDVGQAKFLPQAIQDLGLDKNIGENQLAIALADESLLLPVLHSLPEFSQGVNISMGYPLADTLTLSFIESLIDLHQNKRVKEGTRFYYRNVEPILQHGLLSFVSEQSIGLLDALKKENQIYVPADLLVAGHEVFEAVFKADVDETNFVDYLQKALSCIIAHQFEKEDALASVEQESIYRAYTNLNRLKDILAKAKVPFSLSSLARLLKKILQRITVPFTGEPLSGVQVMGVLETRNLDFENLIILSMNEGVFPKSGNVPSMIPYILRKGFDLPTVEHQDAIFAYYFYRLLQRSKKVTMLCCTAEQGMQSSEPSRFLHQLHFSPEFKLQKYHVNYQVFPSAERKMGIPKTEGMIQSLLHKYGRDGKFLSPSAINTYLSCGMQFFYRYVAKLYEPDEVSEEIQANVFGSILHKSMALLYADFEKKILGEKDIEGIQRKKDFIAHCINQAFWEEYLAPGKEFKADTQIEYKGKVLLIRKVIARYIDQILKFDKKEAPLEIIALEKAFTTMLEVPGKNVKIQVGGFIDRLDIKDGKVRVIDYKTGSSKLQFTKLDSLFEEIPSKRNSAAFQTFLYSSVISHAFPEHSILPALFYVRDIYKEDFKYQLCIGARGDKRDVNNFKELQAEFDEQVKAVLADLFSSESSFVQTEDTDYCRYCSFKGICLR